MVCLNMCLVCHCSCCVGFLIAIRTFMCVCVWGVFLKRMRSVVHNVSLRHALICTRARSSCQTLITPEHTHTHTNVRLYPRPSPQSIKSAFSRLLPRTHHMRLRTEAIGNYMWHLKLGSRISVFFVISNRYALSSNVILHGTSFSNANWDWMALEWPGKCTWARHVCVCVYWCFCMSAVISIYTMCLSPMTSPKRLHFVAELACFSSSRPFLTLRDVTDFCDGGYSISQKWDTPHMFANIFMW